MFDFATMSKNDRHGENHYAIRLKPLHAETKEGLGGFYFCLCDLLARLA